LKEQPVDKMPKKRRAKKRSSGRMPGTPQSRAIVLKDKGNRALQDGDLWVARSYYSEAIEEDSENHALYSNRSLCNLKLGDFESALQDARKCIELKKDWPKGYLRLGAAQEGLMQFLEAQTTFQNGLLVDPINEPLKSALLSI